MNNKFHNDDVIYTIIILMLSKDKIENLRGSTSYTSLSCVFIAISKYDINNLVQCHVMELSTLRMCYTLR